jgi:hypothetical protein
MKRCFSPAVLALVLVIGCTESTTVEPGSSSPQMSSVTNSTVPTGERVLGRTALIPIFDWSTGGLQYGSTPMGPALWPAKPSADAQNVFYLVVYPIQSTVGPIQCYDVPNETCPDHGPVIAGAAMQFLPTVYGAGVLGHDHLSPPHGKEFHATLYPILVLFTHTSFANQRLTTRAAVNAAAARGEVFLAPAEGFSFLNAVVNQTVWANATPWVCPAYTACPPPLGGN